MFKFSFKKGNSVSIEVFCFVLFGFLLRNDLHAFYIFMSYNLNF